MVAGLGSGRERERVCWAGTGWQVWWEEISWELRRVAGTWRQEEGEGRVRDGWGSMRIDGFITPVPVYILA